MKIKMEHEKVINYPLATEKAIRLLNSESKIIFVVERKSTKEKIKKAIERLYGIKVLKVNTLITPKGKKKAIVKFADNNEAIDLATKLGLM